MTTISEAARIIALRGGQPLEYVSDVINNITENGSCRSVTETLAHSIIATAACAPPESAASMARHYSALTDNEGTAAGDMIERILRAFLLYERTEFSRMAYRSWLNIYRTRPAICIVSPHEELIFSEAHDPDAWCAGGAQEYTTVSGKLLYDIASDLNIAAAVAA